MSQYLGQEYRSPGKCDSIVALELISAIAVIDQPRCQFSKFFDRTTERQRRQRRQRRQKKTEFPVRTAEMSKIICQPTVRDCRPLYIERFER